MEKTKGNEKGRGICLVGALVLVILLLGNVSAVSYASTSDLFGELVTSVNEYNDYSFFMNRFGIGTSSPQNKLNVIGTVNATAFVGDGSGLTGVGLWTNSSGDATFVEGNVGIGTTSPTQAKLVVSGGIYATGDVSALTFTDRTPFYDGDALTEISKISGLINGEINHTSLPKFVQVEKNKTIYELRNVTEPFFDEKTKEPKNKTVEKEIEIRTEIVIERNIGNMISVLVKAVQQLFDKDTELENRIKLLENELCKANSSFCQI